MRRLHLVARGTAASGADTDDRNSPKPAKRRYRVPHLHNYALPLRHEGWEMSAFDNPLSGGELPGAGPPRRA